MRGIGGARLKTLLYLAIFGFIAIGVAAAGTLAYQSGTPQGNGLYILSTVGSAINGLKSILGLSSQSRFYLLSGGYYSNTTNATASTNASYTLTIVNCTNSTTNAYQQGVNVSITTQPTCNGNPFVGWAGTGNESYSNSSTGAQVTMDSNITESATYAANATSLSSAAIIAAVQTLPITATPLPSSVYLGPVAPSGGQVCANYPAPGNCAMGTSGYANMTNSTEEYSVSYIDEFTTQGTFTGTPQTVISNPYTVYIATNYNAIPYANSGNEGSLSQVAVALANANYTGQNDMNNHGCVYTPTNPTPAHNCLVVEAQIAGLQEIGGILENATIYNNEVSTNPLPPSVYSGPITPIGEQACANYPAVAGNCAAGTSNYTTNAGSVETYSVSYINEFRFMSTPQTVISNPYNVYIASGPLGILYSNSNDANSLNAVAAALANATSAEQADMGNNGCSYSPNNANLAYNCAAVQAQIANLQVIQGILNNATAYNNAIQTKATTGSAPPKYDYAYVTDLYFPSSYGDVGVINLATNTLIREINVSNPAVIPTSVAVNPSGTLAYVGLDNSTVRVINTATSAVINTISVGSYPLSIAFNPQGTLAYVTNEYGGTVSVIATSATGGTVTNTINLNIGPAACFWPSGDAENYPDSVAFNPSGTLAYVPNECSGIVSVINTSTSTVVNAIKVGTYPWDMAINPSGTIAYVANDGSGTVSVISTATNTVTNTIAVGAGPIAVAFNPSGTEAYVGTWGGTVSVINTATSTVINTITGFKVPDSLALNPSGTIAYAVNEYSDNVTMINTSTNSIIGAIAGVGGSIYEPMGIAIAALPEPVYSTLEVSQISPANPTANSGQFVTFNAAVSGGAPPYNATWFGGGSSNCASDTNVIMAEGQLNSTSLSITTSPIGYNYLCLMVNDSTGTSVYAPSDHFTASNTMAPAFPNAFVAIPGATIGCSSGGILNEYTNTTQPCVTSLPASTILSTINSYLKSNYPQYNSTDSTINGAYDTWYGSNSVEDVLLDCSNYNSANTTPCFIEFFLNGNGGIANVSASD